MYENSDDGMILLILTTPRNFQIVFRISGGSLRRKPVIGLASEGGSTTASAGSSAMLLNFRVDFGTVLVRFAFVETDLLGISLVGFVAKILPALSAVLLDFGRGVRGGGVGLSAFFARETFFAGFGSSRRCDIYGM